MPPVHDDQEPRREGATLPPALLRCAPPSTAPLREALLQRTGPPPEPQQLTLVLAPTGYAKTATVENWLEQHHPAGLPVEWLRCSALGPGTLWDGITRALAPHAVEGQAGSGAAPCTSADAERPRASPHSTRLLARGIGTRMTLVIDDFELVTSAETDVLVAEFSRAIPLLSLVVISRRVTLLDGPLVAAKTRVRLVDAAALRLTREETAELATTLGAPSSQSLHTALERTAGWPLAVMAALSGSSSARNRGPRSEGTLGGPAAPGGFDPLANLDAFALDSLELLSARERSVLLAAAEVDAIGAPLVERLLDIEGGTARSLCEHLLELGFLTATPSPGGTEYRCHSSVRAPLAAHSRTVVPHEARRRVFRDRAETVTTRSPSTAFRLFCAAEDFDTAERVLAQNFSSIPLDQAATMRTLRTLPESVLEAHPSCTAALLVLEHARPAVTSSRLRFLLALWRRGIAGRLPDGTRTPPGPIHLHLLCQAMVASRISGRLAAASRLMRHVEGRLYIDDDPSPPTERGDPRARERESEQGGEAGGGSSGGRSAARNAAQPDDVAHSSCGALPTIYRELAATALAVGDIPRARATLERLLGTAERPERCPECGSDAATTGSGTGFTTGWQLAALAELALTEAIDGDLRRSRERLERFDTISRATGVSPQGTLWAGAEVARAFLAIETGNSQHIELAVERLAPFYEGFEPGPLLLIATAALIRRSCGPEAALTHLRSGLNTSHRISPPRRPWSDHVVVFEAMLNTTIGNLARAEHLLHGSLTDPPSFRLERARIALFAGEDVGAVLLAENLDDPRATKRSRVDRGLILATAAWGCGRLEEAVTAFSAAAALIGEYQLSSPLLSVPYGQLHAVAVAARDSGSCDLLALVEGIPPPARATRYERLTAMELQALAAISEHRNTGQAAESLFVTTGTVKKHLAAVYRKLGVGDRDAAILRASRMGLLD